MSEENSDSPTKRRLVVPAVRKATIPFLAKKKMTSPRDFAENVESEGKKDPQPDADPTSFSAAVNNSNALSTEREEVKQASSKEDVSNSELQSNPGLPDSNQKSHQLEEKPPNQEGQPAKEPENHSPKGILKTEASPTTKKSVKFDTDAEPAQKKESQSFENQSQETKPNVVQQQDEKQVSSDTQIQPEGISESERNANKIELAAQENSEKNKSEERTMIVGENNHDQAENSAELSKNNVNSQENQESKVLEECEQVNEKPDVGMIASDVQESIVDQASEGEENNPNDDDINREQVISEKETNPAVQQEIVTEKIGDEIDVSGSNLTEEAKSLQVDQIEIENKPDTVQADSNLQSNLNNLENSSVDQPTTTSAHGKKLTPSEVKEGFDDVNGDPNDNDILEKEDTLENETNLQAQNVLETKNEPSEKKEGEPPAENSDQVQESAQEYIASEKSEQVEEKVTSDQLNAISDLDQVEWTEQSQENEHDSNQGDHDPIQKECDPNQDDHDPNENNTDLHKEEVDPNQEEQDPNENCADLKENMENEIDPNDAEADPNEVVTDSNVVEDEVERDPNEDVSDPNENVDKQIQDEHIDEEDPNASVDPNESAQHADEYIQGEQANEEDPNEDVKNPNEKEQGANEGEQEDPQVNEEKSQEDAIGNVQQHDTNSADQDPNEGEEGVQENKSEEISIQTHENIIETQQISQENEHQPREFTTSISNESHPADVQVKVAVIEKKVKHFSDTASSKKRNLALNVEAIEQETLELWKPSQTEENQENTEEPNEGQDPNANDDLNVADEKHADEPEEQNENLGSEPAAHDLDDQEENVKHSDKEEDNTKQSEKAEDDIPPNVNNQIEDDDDFDPNASYQEHPIKTVEKNDNLVNNDSVNNVEEAHQQRPESGDELDDVNSPHVDVEQSQGDDHEASQINDQQNESVEVADKESQQARDQQHQEILVENIESNPAEAEEPLKDDRNIEKVENEEVKNLNEEEVEQQKVEIEEEVPEEKAAGEEEIVPEEVEDVNDQGTSGAEQIVGENNHDDQEDPNDPNDSEDPNDLNNSNDPNDNNKPDSEAEPEVQKNNEYQSNLIEEQVQDPDAEADVSIEGKDHPQENEELQTDSVMKNSTDVPQIQEEGDTDHTTTVNRNFISLPPHQEEEGDEFDDINSPEPIDESPHQKWELHVQPVHQVEDSYDDVNKPEISEIHQEPDKVENAVEDFSHDKESPTSTELQTNTLSPQRESCASFRPSASDEKSLQKTVPSQSTDGVQPEILSSKAHNLFARNSSHGSLPDPSFDDVNGDPQDEIPEPKVPNLNLHQLKRKGGEMSNNALPSSQFKNAGINLTLI